MYLVKGQSFIQRVFVEYPFVPGTELDELNMQMNKILLSALQLEESQHSNNYGEECRVDYYHSDTQKTSTQFHYW